MRRMTTTASHQHVFRSDFRVLLRMLSERKGLTLRNSCDRPRDACHSCDSMHTEWRTRRRRVRHINKSFLDFSSRLNLTNAYLTPQHTLYKLTAARTAPKSAHSRLTAPLRAGTTTPSRDPQIIEFPPNFDNTRPLQLLHTFSTPPYRPA